MAKRKTFYVPAAIFDGDRSAYAIAVYSYLCFCADKSGTCFPGISVIAARTGASRSSVKRALAELEKSGMIRSEETRQASKSGRLRQGTNRYRILDAPVPKGPLPRSAEDPFPVRREPLPRSAENPLSGPQGTSPRSTENREINKNCKNRMGDVPSVGTTAREEDMTGLDTILEPLYLDTFYDRTFAESVEQAIRTMYVTPTLSVNGVRVPNDLIRKRLKLLTIDHIDFVEKQLKERGTEVTSGDRYLMACIYNAPVDCMVKSARDSNA